MKKDLWVTLLLAITGTLSYAASEPPKLLSTDSGTVTGTLSYAAGQYSLQTEKETLCVMYDAGDDAKLAPLNGVKVSFTGPIQVWSDKKRCILVNPIYPKAVK